MLNDDITHTSAFSNDGILGSSGEHFSLIYAHHDGGLLKNIRLIFVMNLLVQKCRACHKCIPLWLTTFRSVTAAVTLTQRGQTNLSWTKSEILFVSRSFSLSNRMKCISPNDLKPKLSRNYILPPPEAKCCNAFSFYYWVFINCCFLICFNFSCAWFSVCLKFHKCLVN